MRKTRPNSTRHLRRRLFRTFFEILEPRLLLDGSNVFARFTGELAYDHPQQSIPFSVSPNDFALSGNKTVLGFQVQRVGAGSLDPAAVAILNASGSAMPLRFSASDLAAYSQSLVIAELPYGNYTAIVASDRCSIGGFRLDVSLAGDVNGDRKVDQNELTLVRNMTGATSSSSAYRIEADSNLDGIITTFDYTQARDNLNDSTRLNPLTSVTLRASPAPITLSNGALVTNSSSPNIFGTTLPSLSVALETGSDGKFDNGSTTSDASGNYSFGAIPLQPGANALQARVIDAFGQSVFATLNVTLDNVAPVIAIQSALPQFTRIANFIMSGQVTDNYAGVRRFELALDTGAFATPTLDAQGNFTTNTSLAGASEGTHTIHLRATDNAGNISVRDISFTLDTRPPTIAGSRTPVANADGWNNTDVVAIFLASDSMSGLGFVTAPVTLSGEGAGQSIEGTAIDLAGNSALAIVGGINIDKTKPITSSSLNGLVGSNGWYRGPVTVRLGATDNLAQVRATYHVLDNGSTQKYTGPIAASIDGFHTINYWSVDNADNEETYHNQTIQIDTQSPTITVASPAVGSVASVNPTVAGQLTDTGSGIASLEARIDNDSFFAVSVNSSGNYSFVTSLALDGSFDGLHTVHLRATDRAGNVSSLTDVPFNLQTGLTLREGTAFEVTRQQSITIPTQASALTFTFSGPAFDVTSQGLVKDSFEVALVDAAGHTLVPTFAAQRDAFFNISEGQAAVLGSWARIDSRTVTLDLSHVTPGIPATLLFRLVNNDRDINTFVNVSDVNVIPLTGQPVEQGGQPVSVSLAPASIDFSHMTDVSGSFQPIYSRTSFNDATKVLSASIAAKNAGQYPVNKPLIVAIDHISDPNIRVRGADGLTPTGLPYFDLSNLVTSGTIESGSITNDRTLSFYNPGRIQFTYDLNFLGQLNRDPQITTHANLEALVDKPYTYAVAATDPDGDALTFSLLTAPTGMAIDSHTGAISWSPQAADFGNQSVILRIEDGHGGSAQQQYALSVIQTPPNRPPMFTSTPVVSANVGDLYAYHATATDPDGDPLTFYLSQTRSVSIVNPGFEDPVLVDGTYNDSLTGWSGSGSYGTWNVDGVYQSGAPEGHNVAYSTGNVLSQSLTETLQPNTRYILSADIGFLAGTFPGASLQLWAGNTLLVEDTSTHPALGSFSRATVQYITSSVPTNGPLEIRLKPLGASAELHFDNVILTANTPPTATTFSPAGMNVDPSTGIVQWTPTAEQAHDSSLQNVVLSIEDGHGGKTTQSFAVSVLSAPDNHSPIITSEPVIAVDEGAPLYQYNVKAIDPDNDPLTYALSKSPIGMSINPTTGQITWPSPAVVSQGLAKSAYSASSEFAHDTAELAFDGDTGTLWNAGRHPLGWVEVDLGRNFRIDHLSLLSEQTPAGFTTHEIWVSDSPIGDTRLGAADVYTFSGTTNDNQTFNIAFPDTIDARYVQVRTTRSPSWVAWREIQVFAGHVEPVQVDVYDNRGGTSSQDFTVDVTAPVLSTRLSEIRGTKFNDFNGNGTRDQGESGLLNWIIYLDQNRNGSRDANELWTTTDQSGNYVFSDLLARQYIIREENRIGWNQTTHSNAAASLILNGDFENTSFTLLPDDSKRYVGWTEYQVNDGFSGIFLEGQPGHELSSFDTTSTELDGDSSAAPDFFFPYVSESEPNQDHFGFARPSGPAPTSSYAEFVSDPFVIDGSISMDVWRESSSSMSQVRFVDAATDEILGSFNVTAARKQWTRVTFDTTSFLGRNVYIVLHGGTDQRGFGWLTLFDNIFGGPPGSMPGDPLSTGIVVSLSDGQVARGIDFGNQFVGTPTAPSITSPAPTTATVGKRLRYNVTVDNPDGVVLQFDLPIKPEGMTVDPVTGIVTWIPTASQVSTQDVLLRVQDARGDVVLQSFQIAVHRANSAPVILTSQALSSAAVGVPFTLQVEAQDADGDPLAFSLGFHPIGMSIDIASGILAWTPGSEALGAQPFIVRVSDGQGGVATRAFNLVVAATAVNGNPIIVSTPPNKVGLGQRYLYSVQANDPDGNPLNYQLDVAPNGMTINSTGLIVWAPVGSQLGLNAVTVRVEDGRGGSAQQSFTINVSSQSANDSPTITSVPPTIVTLGSAYKYAPVGNDPDADLLTWSLDTAPAGMSINARLGTIFWTPTADQIGSQSVAIRLTDSQGGETTQSYLIVVKQNTPPEITSIPPTVAVVNSVYQYSVTAIDDDNDPLTYTLLDAPTGMTINSSTGVVQWTPTPTQASSGTVLVIIDVQDHQSGGAQQTYSIAILQTAVNQPPTITSTPAFAASVGQLYSYAVKATDPENQAIQFSIRSPLPTGMLIDSNTGVISWTPTVNQVGTTSLTVIATDAQGASAYQTYPLSVTVNHAPIITSVPVLQVAAGANYRYDIIATDPDRDLLTYALTQRPAGMTIDSLGRIAWSPAIANIGTSHVSLTVTDKLGASVNQAFDVSVVADSQAPKVGLDLSSNPADVGSSVTFVVTAIDNVKVQSLALRVNGVPVALDSSGRATLKMNLVGDVSVIATATDAAGNVGNASAILTVRDPSVTNQPVVDFDSPAADAVLTNATNVIGSVIDSHLLFYTLSIAPLGSDHFTEFARGTSAVSHGLLGKFDPSLLSNDGYVLRLYAKNTGGVETILDREISIAGNLKLGNFKLSFTDLTIPVAGIPITVSRTYDSLNANSSEDFGFGWRLEFSNVDLRFSTPKTGGEADLIYNPFKNGTRVYVTLPGGQRQGFTFHPTLAPGLRGSFLGIYLPHFDPDPGVTNQLSVPDYNLSVDSDGYTYAYSDDLPYNPASSVFGGNFILATTEGIAYTINGTSGKLTTVLDAHGNTLTFTDAGIISSAGPQVTFDRDPQGRIVAVTDPSGKKVTYQYDTKGDLIAVNDRQGNTTQFVYEAPRDHYLTKVIDPLGHAGLRTEYDNTGRLVSMTDASGKSVQQSYDPTHSTETVKDQLGNPTTYEYDDRGNIVTETNALGGITRRAYDGGDNMLSETDPLGRTTNHTYDARANVLSETDPLGHVTYHTYQTIQLFSNLRVPLLPTYLEATTSDALGNTTTNVYEINGNLLSMTDAIGRTTRFVYDGSGNPTSLSDTGGNTTSFVYGGGGKLISQTDALGHVTTYEYDANGNQTKQSTTLTTPTGVRSLVTTTEFDADGRVVKVTDAEGNVTRNEYDAAGNRTATVNARGNRTRFDYSERGELIQTTYPDGSTMQSVYDAAGHATAQIDQLGRRTEMKYDALGRLVETDYPDRTPNDPTDNPRTKTVYNAAGEVTAQVDERGNRTEFEYDNAGRQTVVRDALGHQSVSGYNIAGGLISQTDPLGHTTRFVLDDVGRQVETDFADGTHTSVAFDSSGRVASRTDQLGRITRYEYDALGHLKAVVDALNQRTEYGNDDAGNLFTQKDANGHITRYEYDGLGRRIATVLPLGQRSSSTYDAVGDMVSATDFNGATITYDYNALNQLVTQHMPGGSVVAFTYTASGQRATVTDDRGLTVYAYDSRDHLLSRKDPDGTTISYTYDSAGNRTSVTTPAGKVLYTFDTLNHTSSVTDPSGGLTQYKYDVIGNLIESDFPNNTKELKQYDSLNRLTYLENDGPSGVISSYRYTLGPTGRRNAVVENNGRRVDYSYDADDRLTREAVVDAVFGDRTFDYTYDPVGNRLSRDDSVEGLTTSTYDNNDRILTESLEGTLTQYTYDNNGNTLSKFTSALDHVFYRWDAQNRLIGADVIDATGTHHSAYRYDVDGIRVSQTVDAQETRYLIDTVQPYAQVLLEYQASGLAIVSYVYGNSLISQNRSDVWSYYERDGLGSTRSLTSSVGTITDQYVYDAFGRIVRQMGSTINSYLFTGQQRDTATGLDYLRARYMNVNLGRFFSRDRYPPSLDLPMTLNPFAYANGNPISNADPTGNETSLLEISVADSIANSLRITLAGSEAYAGLYVASRLPGILIYANHDVQQSIRTVSRDSTFAHYANSPYWWEFGRYAGSARNLYFIAAGKSPSDRDAVGGVFEYVCVGIAERARNLLENDNNVDHVETIDRGLSSLFDPAHTAVLIKYKTGLEVVLDWHATLNKDFPVIYRSAEDFRAGTIGWYYGYL